MLSTLAMAPWATNLLILVLLGVAVLLILTVLIQRPQGGGLSAAFGSSGSGQTAFGTKTGDALTVFTVIMFTVFVFAAIGLNFGMRPAVVAEAPAIGATPASNTATPPGTNAPASGGTTPASGADQVPAQQPTPPTNVEPPAPAPTPEPAPTPAPTPAPAPTEPPQNTPPAPAPGESPKTGPEQPPAAPK